MCKARPTLVEQVLLYAALAATDAGLHTAAGSLKDVSSKIPDVRAALKTISLDLLVYVVIRLDVAAKAGPGCC